MAGEIARLYAKVGVDTREFDRGMKSVRGGLMDAQSAMKAFGAVITAYGVRAVVEYGMELGKLGAQHQRLEASFRQLSKAPEAMLSSMRRASSGTISETQMILAANRAMLLGVTSDAEKIGQLMEVARFRGRAMGLSTQQAFSDIVTGIGRQSALILDNLGIVVDAEGRYAQYAASVGKAASSLTEAEKRQALLNGVLEDGQRQIAAVGGLTDDMADSFERLAAAKEDAKTAIGELTAPFTADMVGNAANFARVLKLMIDLVKGGGGGSEGIFYMLDMMASGAGLGGAPENPVNRRLRESMPRGMPWSMPYATPSPYALPPIGPGSYLLGGALPSTGEARFQTLAQPRSITNPMGFTVAGELSPEKLAELKAKSVQLEMDEFGNVIEDLGRQAQFSGGKLPTAADGMRDAGYAAAGLTSSMRMMNKAINDSGWLVTHNLPFRQTPKMPTPPQYLFDPELALGGYAEDVKKRAEEKADAEAKAAEEAKRAAVKYWDDLASRAKSAYDDILGIAGGAFRTPDDSTRFGLVGTPFQMGESWDENARRVEDVGNLGKASPWFAQFAGQFAGIEDNAEARKARAAQIAADIRESPTMGEIGPEGYKALVDNAKKNIMNQVAMEDLKTKIAADLMSDPAAMAGMKKLGIDVDAAMKSVGEQQVDQLKAMQKQTNVFVTNWKGGGGDGGGGATATGNKTFIPGVGYVESHASGGVVGWGLPRGTPVLSLDHAGEVVSNGRQAGGRSFYFAPGSINVSGVKDLGGFIQQLEALRSMQG